jgi:hypothetical protein
MNRIISFFQQRSYSFRLMPGVTVIKLFTMAICALALGRMAAQTPLPPATVTAEGFENHIEVRWTTSANATGYKIYKSSDSGASWSLLKQTGDAASLIDWTAAEGQNLTRSYQVSALNPAGESAPSTSATAVTQPMSDSALLDMVQRYSFRFFWDYAHPISGMARDRNNGDPNVVTTGGTGFGVMSIIVATERGWISRTDAVNQLVKIVSFLQFANTFHGAFPHFMNGTTGEVVPFSQLDNGADLVETAFLIQGLLAARQYYNLNDPSEAGLRDAITSIWKAVQWDWFRKNNGAVLYWHWSPNYAWQMNFPLYGFFEAQIVYILAVASPTHPIPATLYHTGWTGSNYSNLNNYYGLPVYCGPYGGGPMFFAHYSYLGFDPRNIKDGYCNYFKRNRNQALIQHAYSIANPSHYAGYGADCWGLTASDDPVDGYKAHDIYPSNDNGTISPTAALASMPYTPAESMAALKYFYRNVGQNLWGDYGFYDAFNQKLNWYAPSYLAIDQGPIVDMIENHRTGLLWKNFMQNPEIQPALQAIGFQPDNSATTEPDIVRTGFDVDVAPNPVWSGGPVHLTYNVLRAQQVSLDLYGLDGQLVQHLFTGKELLPGAVTLTEEIPKIPAGVYLLKFQNNDNQIVIKKILYTPDKP